MIGSIPNYELYGELVAGNYTDLVHHETIQKRSSKHKWTIRLHRHRSLVQIFIFRTEGVYVHLGDVEYTSTSPMIVVVPPGVPHGFRFPTDVAGDVLSLRHTELELDYVNRIGQLVPSGIILTHKDTKHFENVNTLIQQFSAMYHSVEQERSTVLVGLIQVIFGYLSSDLRWKTQTLFPTPSLNLSRHQQQADNFCALVENHFLEDWTVSNYAHALSLSAPHLTRVCKNILGVPPNELVRQRRLLESKRLLEYTHLSIAEVAHRSGFKDAPFFSRTFKKLTGIAPKDFRHTIRSEAHPA